MSTVREIFDTMAYGPAPEGHAEALAWISGHQGRFGHWINGAFTAAGATFETRNPATGKVLAEVSQGSGDDIAAAVAAARAAQGKWARLGGAARARVLYALARLVQKHARLFAVLETLDNGKPIRESRDIDVPLAVRHFIHHAGWAQSLGWCLPCTPVFEGMRAIIRGQGISWGLMGLSLLTNAVWMVLAGGIYLWVLRQGRRQGMLTRVTSH